MFIQLSLARAARAAFTVGVLTGATVAAPTPQNGPNWQSAYEYPGLDSAPNADGYPSPSQQVAALHAFLRIKNR